MESAAVRAALEESLGKDDHVGTQIPAFHVAHGSVLGAEARLTVAQVRPGVLARPVFVSLVGRPAARTCLRRSEGGSKSRSIHALPPTGTALPRERVSDLEADERCTPTIRRPTGKLGGR
jgi:hypothetical protein